MDTERLRALKPELDRFLEDVQPRFAEAKTAAHLGTYVRGQLGALERKSVEPIAIEAGVPVRTLQEFFSIHRWDANDLRHGIRRILVRDHASPSSIGILDETAFPKRGTKTAGVQRQYCGATGKVDNCLVTVHLGYAAGDFHALADSDIYLPESWTNDRERCRSVGVPDFVKFRPKWLIGFDLIERSLADGLPLRWITADEGYAVPALFNVLADRGLLYVIEVPRKLKGWVRDTTYTRIRRLRRVDDIWRRGGPAWSAYRVKDTTRGPLVWNARAVRFCPSWAPDNELWLVVAHNPLTDETKYFLSNASKATSVESMLSIAFSRWRVERLFEDAKQEVGLADFEMRRYDAVQRHIAVSMASLLFLYRTQRSLGGSENIAIDLATQEGHRDPARSVAHASAG